MALPAFSARYIASTGYTSGSQWTDQSGNGNHITSAGGGTWPAAVTAAGKTFLRFNGSTNRLAQAAVTVNQQNGTIIVIGRNRSNNGDCVFGAGAWPGILLTVKTGEIPTCYFGGYNDCAELAGDTFTLFGLRMSGSAIGIIYGAEETAGSAFAAGTQTGITIGASDATGTLTGTWDVCEVMVCAARATDVELQSIRDYAVATYGCGGGTKDMALYLTGDSLFLGYNITPPTQDNDVIAGMEARYTADGLSCPPIRFAAKSGWRIGTTGSTSSLYDDLTSDAAAWLTDKAGYTVNGVVCNACVNDALVDGLTAAQIFTRAQAYIAQAISLGATDVYMGTMSVSDGAAQETLRNTYNTALKADSHQSTGPRYIDIGADAFLGTYAERTNATYFQLDMLHWTAAGDDRAAQILYDRLAPAAPGTIVLTIDGDAVAEDGTVQLSAGSHTIRVTASGGDVTVSGVTLGGGVGGTLTSLIDTITDGDYREVSTLDISGAGTLRITSDSGDGQFDITVDLLPSFNRAMYRRRLNRLGPGAARLTR